MIPYSFWKEHDVKLPGLALWLDAAYYSSSTGTWTDRSGNGYDVTQAAADRRPAFVSNTINGFPAARFDGTDDLLQNTSFPALGAGGRTIITIARSTYTTIPSVRYICALGDNAAVGNLYGLTREVFVRCSTRTIDYTSVNMEGSFKLLTSSCESTTLNNKLYLNNTEIAASAFNSSGAINTAGVVTIGNFNLGGTSYWVGDIAEIIIYNRVLTASERSIVHGYLNMKYNLY